MSTRSLTTFAAALLALAPVGASAQRPPVPARPSPPSIERSPILEKASREHAAAARRFRAEAERYAEEAARDAQEAAAYRERAHLSGSRNDAALAAHCLQLSKDLQAAATDARKTAELEELAAKVLSQ